MKDTITAVLLGALMLAAQDAPVQRGAKALFFDPTSALPNIKFRNEFGWALQAGMDVPVGDGPYFLNFDVKKLFLNTTVLANGGAVRAGASLDPWLIGAGVGLRF